MRVYLGRNSIVYYHIQSSYADLACNHSIDFSFFLRGPLRNKKQMGVNTLSYNTSMVAIPSEAM